MPSQEKILGRQDELAVLEQFYASDKAEFLALYGRRRVGKTFLVRQFFDKKNCTFFYATGIHKASAQQQISELTKEISRTFYQGTEIKQKKNWFDTLELLTQIIQNQTPKNKKIVLFFDEFPWMATHRSKLLQALEYYWNRHWSQDNRIKLIICGSAAAWIIRNIINNKGGLHNRITRALQLEPMSLLETKNFLYGIGIKLNNKQISQIYMVMGGIPYYLSQIDPGLSATQVIEKLAFTKNSFLFREFDNLYSSLFDEAESYIEIVRAIASKKYGVGQEELFGKIKLSSKGGTIVKKLKDLENTGFIISFTPYQHRKKGIYYKIIDEYTLFYFNWIEPVKETLLKQRLRKGYWHSIEKTAGWHAWSGYAFEALCYKHTAQISEALSLSVTSLPSTWRYIPTKLSQEQGAQVDLLFDRDDDVITLCEIKHTDQPFTIDKLYFQKLNQKMAAFKKITQTKKQLFFVIISANGIKKTIYSEEIVNGLVTLDDLFKRK